MYKKSLVLLLPRCSSAFCSSVLKPNFNLTLRQAQSISQPSSFCCSQVLRGIKCLLKFINLHSRECCSAFLFFLSIFGTFISIPWFASEGGGGDEWVWGYADETGGRSLSMGTFIANCRGQEDEMVKLWFAIIYAQHGTEKCSDYRTVHSDSQVL